MTFLFVPALILFVLTVSCLFVKIETDLCWTDKTIKLTRKLTYTITNRTQDCETDGVHSCEITHKKNTIFFLLFWFTLMKRPEPACRPCRRGTRRTGQVQPWVYFLLYCHPSQRETGPNRGAWVEERVEEKVSGRPSLHKLSLAWHTAGWVRVGGRTSGLASSLSLGRDVRGSRRLGLSLPAGILWLVSACFCCAWLSRLKALIESHRTKYPKKSARMKKKGASGCWRSRACWSWAGG